MYCYSLSFTVSCFVLKLFFVWMHQLLRRHHMNSSYINKYRFFLVVIFMCEKKCGLGVKGLWLLTNSPRYWSPWGKSPLIWSSLLPLSASFDTYGVTTAAAPVTGRSIMCTNALSVSAQIPVECQWEHLRKLEGPPQDERGAWCSFTLLLLHLYTAECNLTITRYFILLYLVGKICIPFISNASPAKVHPPLFWLSVCITLVIIF